jgi:chromosome segregation ATPase
MDQEQLEKKIDWLEKERREDKQVIASLQKRLADLEGQLERTNNYSQNLETEITKFGVRLGRIDAFDEALSVLRTDVKKELDSQEKRVKSREKYSKSKYDDEIASLKVDLEELSSKLIAIPGLRDAIEINKKEVERQNKLFTPLEVGIRDNQNAHQDLVQKVRIMEEDRAPDKRKFADIQGELSALRKRIDEQRGLYEMMGETYKKIDNRVNEMIISEDQRRENQRSFIEEISRRELDVDKAFKEWTKRFDSIEQRAETLTTALQTYTEVERSLRKAQGEFDTITEQISRRIHEITEMQRLGEERFRQEWTTFKSDDQKRWVNYTLSQEEQVKESGRKFERLNDRTTTLEEMLQDLQDAVQQSNEQIETLLHNLLGVFRDWVSANERFSDSL